MSNFDLPLDYLTAKMVAASCAPIDQASDEFLLNNRSANFCFPFAACAIKMQFNAHIICTNS